MKPFTVLVHVDENDGTGAVVRLFHVSAPDGASAVEDVRRNPISSHSRSSTAI